MERAESAVVRIGADWDEKKCVVAWRDGAKLRTSHVLRNPESIKAFAARFLNQGQDDGEEGVVGHRPTIEVAIEAGDPYWVKLWSQVAGEVLVFDGKKTRRFAESLVSSGASDDRRSAKVLVEMFGALRYHCLSNDVDFLALSQSRIKKYATGVGKDVEKSAMVMRAFKEYGLDLSDDEADAFWAAGPLARIMPSTR